MILFHGTDREFDAFSSDFLNTREDRHANGNLGLWVADHPELAGRFGAILLAVETPGDKTFDLEIGDLSQMAQDYSRSGDAVAKYRAFSRDLIAQGFDIIAIRECNGSAPTRILLEPERCRIVARARTDDEEAMAEVSGMATEVDATVPFWP